MANFTTEALVREKFQLNDTTLVPSALVTKSIDDAHTELLRYLDPNANTSPPDAALVIGETLLAGAHLFRALASKDAFEQRWATVGGQHLEPGSRFSALLATAAAAAEQSWQVLEPYLAARPGRSLAGVTDTYPLLGEE
jgi:hypothetical protein